jgi:hypothetical protein
VLATANAHWEVASFLLDRGADPNAAGAGWNALHQTVHSRRPNLGYTPGPVPTGNTDSIELVKKLIAKGIDIDARMTKNSGGRQRNRRSAWARRRSCGDVDVGVMKVYSRGRRDAATSRRQRALMVPGRNGDEHRQTAVRGNHEHGRSRPSDVRGANNDVNARTTSAKRAAARFAA